MHDAPSMFLMSATVPVKKASDQARAAARRPAVPGSLGEAGGEDTVEPKAPGVHRTKRIARRQPVSVGVPLPWPFGVFQSGPRTSTCLHSEPDGGEARVPDGRART